MNPYRDATMATAPARPRARRSDSSWAMTLAAIPILLHAVDFPARTGNVVIWVALGAGMFVSGTYAVIALLFTVSCMTREAQQRRSPGVFDQESYDEAGRAALRGFRRGCLIFGVFFALAAIATLVFPI